MDTFKDILKGFFEHFGWFFLVLLALALIWFFNGGPDRMTAHEGQYLKPLAPVDSGQAYGTYYAGTPTNQKTTLDLPEAPANVVKNAETAVGDFVTQAKRAVVVHSSSLSANGIYLDGEAGAGSSDPKTEYMRIMSSYSAKTAIDISGLWLTGTNIPQGIAIPGAAVLPIEGVRATTTDVLLPPGGRALVSTGASPVGFSFQINKCSGYFNELGVFTPGLRNECPDGSGCKANPAKNLSYNSCVVAHQNDAGFYTSEWRLFFGLSTQIWSASNEIIKLIDPNGHIVDELTY